LENDTEQEGRSLSTIQKTVRLISESAKDAEGLVL